MGTKRIDPLGVHVDLPLRGAFFPLGFPLEIATNSRDVIEAAAESWSGETRRFDCDPMLMRVRVAPEGPPAGLGRHYKEGHLYSAVSDAHNFAHVDLASQFASVHVSAATAADHSALRWLYVESLAYMMLCQRHVAMIHAGFVARDGAGVLLCGPSTAGKSTLSYACARAGWTWISDDCACLLPDSPDRVALGRSRQARLRPDAARLFPELEPFAPRARPTGTVAIEVAMADLPGIRAARQARVAAIAFLDRRPGPRCAAEVSPAEAAHRLLADIPAYSPDVDAMYERAIARVVEAPAYRVSYESFEDGVSLLSSLL